MAVGPSQPGIQQGSLARGGPLSCRALTASVPVVSLQRKNVFSNESDTDSYCLFNSTLITVFTHLAGAFSQSDLECIQIWIIKELVRSKPYKVYE